MNLEKTVIDNIKRIRKEKRITQEQLAEMCDTATSYIGLMEIYRNVPKLSTIEKIADALQVDAEVLFKKTDKDSDEEILIQKITDSIIEDLRKNIYKAIRENLKN